MGASGSKVGIEPTGGTGPVGDLPMSEVRKKIPDLKAARLAKMVEDKTLFDAHCYFFDYMQHTEGMDSLLKAMDKNGVGYAAICGTSFKKTWVGETDSKGDPKERSKMPVHHLYDDGDLYYYSQTDGNLYRHVLAMKEKHGIDPLGQFSIMMCGMNLGDYFCGEEAEQLVSNYPMLNGFGVITLQSDDVNNVTLKGGNWSFTRPSIKKIIEVCAKANPPLPFVFYSDARSSTSKPYRNDFEYLDEIEMVCEMNPKVKCLWCGSGVFSRGLWKDYIPLLKALVHKYDNLYLSFTPFLVKGGYQGIDRADALALAEELPGRIVLGTAVRGLFMGTPPKEFGEMSYEEEVAELTKFAKQVEARCGKGVAAALRYRTACTVYNLPLPKDPDSKMEVKTAVDRGKSLKSLLSKADKSQSMVEKDAHTFLAALAYGGSASGAAAVCPPSLTDKKWDTIDCHLHLLDFLQKSSGTTAALKAMDGCDCKKAVLFGMPCCKKWCFYRKDQPLYYQDDNGPCYVYAYADQMVADAWLALDDKDRARFAPCFASFDPTDLAAISHVKRLYYKYPKMWRGIGEIMCRHDDLTTMLLSKEIPRVNHPGLDYIYQFACEVDLPCLIHHNADRVGDNDNKFEYIHEVEEVLQKYPKLKFVWVHAGVSRRCSEPNHHEMIDNLCSKYDNLTVDISWVVWEDVICDENGQVKDGWVNTIQKHHTKFFVGSDNVAQYFPIKDTTINLLAGNITKYYKLYEKLTEEAGNNVAYNNAEKLYFANWDMPSGEVQGPYFRMPSYYDTECLDPAAGAFVKGATDLDDDGKY